MDHNKVVVVGSFVQDMAFHTAQFPAPGESRIGSFLTGPGGKGFNQAIACNRHGVSTLFIGAVGDDVFGTEVQNFIAEEDLDAALQIVPGTASGAASVVINAAAENLIVVALGANDALASAHLEALADRLASAQVLLCQLECNLEATTRALRIARDNNVTTILNPAPINAGLESTLLELADVLVPNETEFAYLMRKIFAVELADAYWLDADETLHEHCRQMGAPHVVLTLGDQGCFVSHASTESGLEPPFYRVAARPAHAIDTTGAGDAFNGALAAGMVRFPGNFRRAIEYANAAAALSTERRGAAPSMPSREEVETAENLR